MMDDPKINASKGIFFFDLFRKKYNPSLPLSSNYNHQLMVKPCRYKQWKILPMIQGYQILHRYKLNHIQVTTRSR